MSHVILLIQGGAVESRTYSEYKGVPEAMKGIMKIYEEHQRRKANTQAIKYDISQLFDFLDQVNKGIGNSAHNLNL